MIAITPEHINRLIALESEVNYFQPPLTDVEPFKVIEKEAPVIISAPHGARTFRNSNDQVWHEEDEYTAGIALLLGELCDVSVLVTNCQNNGYDPNYATDINVPYKKTLGDMIQRHHVRFVLDLHGAALYSPTLDPKQTIDLGLRQNGRQKTPSMKISHVNKLESLLADTVKCDPSCFVVGRNKFPGAGTGTIISFSSNQHVFGSKKKVQAIQIEMKPQVRIANRFPTATLYKSCGPYQAQYENVSHMIQSLAHFIEYLKQQE
jgi:hypothetical protein